MRFALAIAALAATAALSACSTDGSGGGGSIYARQQSGVEGDWIGTDGVAISRFSAGRFETLATDTGAKLAEGSYSQRDARTIDITLTSLIRQTTSQVACSLDNPRQLNCTSSSGNQFVLVRRA